MAKILIVDDEPEIVEILESFLEDHHSIETCTTFVEAEKQLKTGHYDLILSDLNMPGVPSKEIVSQYQAADSSVLIVIMSGYGAGSPQIEGALKQGAHASLEKPFFEPADIIETLSNIIDSNKPAQAS